MTDCTSAAHLIIGAGLDNVVEQTPQRAVAALLHDADDGRALLLDELAGRLADARGDPLQPGHVYQPDAVAEQFVVVLDDPLDDPFLVPDLWPQLFSDVKLHRPLD